MSDTSDTSDPWLTIGDAAGRLGVSPPTLRRWAEQGRIGARRTLGGHRRILLSELPRIAPAEVPPRPDRAPRRAVDLSRGRIEVVDDDGALRADRDRLAVQLAEAGAERDTLRERLAEEQAAAGRLTDEVAFLRRQLEESIRAQADLRRVVLRLVDGTGPGAAGARSAARNPARGRKPGGRDTDTAAGHSGR